MGQQQLLLIVLGVIVVGIAVVVGINLFNASAVSANRDGVVADLNNLGAMAQQHYKKPASMGGGALSFNTANGGVAWTIPIQLDTTANGNYVLTTNNGTDIILDGFGTEIGNDGATVINHTATVTGNTITITALVN